ncbi:unnamed protein product, partial [Rotaria sordida]
LIDAEKLYATYQNEEEHENEDLLTLDEKTKKFDEYKQILDKQSVFLVVINFHSTMRTFDHVKFFYYDHDM